MSVLEVVDENTTDDTIEQIESHWKHKLMSADSASTATEYKRPVCVWVGRATGLVGLAAAAALPSGD